MADFASTGISYLVRRVNSGVYYWQAKIGGRSRRGSLRTKSKSVAKTRLPLELSKARRKHESAEMGALPAECPEKAAEWIDRWNSFRQADPSLKSSTKKQSVDVANYLKRSEWACLKIKEVTSDHLQTWWSGFADKSETFSNRHLSAVRAIFKAALDSGVRSLDPSDGLNRIKTKSRVLDLPSTDDFHRVVENIRAGTHPGRIESAFFIEFLAYSGMRIGEAREVTTADIRSDSILIRGGDEGTKGRSERRVPIIPAMSKLLQRMNVSGIEGRLFHSRSPHQALRRACERLEIKHLTPHQLRHLFATTCIESGVDIPTVASWLGHKDGGALAMRTYHHVREKHLARQASKVCFGDANAS